MHPVFTYEKVTHLSLFYGLMFPNGGDNHSVNWCNPKMKMNTRIEKNSKCIMISGPLVTLGLIKQLNLFSHLWKESLGQSKNDPPQSLSDMPP